MLAAALIATLAAAAAWFVLWREPQAPRVTRFVIDEQSVASGGLAISSDGTRIAFVAERGLVVRSRDRLESTLVAARNLVQGDPFFSPDGEWVGFKGWAALRKVSASGGPVSTVLDQRVASIGTWTGEDIFFADMTGVFRISAAGGKPVALATAVQGEQINFVEALPSRRAILFTVVPAHDNNADRSTSVPSARIEALDLVTGLRHTVMRGGGQPRYTRTGHLLYVSSGTLYAIAFDVDRLQTRGTAVPVIEGDGLLDYDVSKEGTLIYRSAAAEPRREMVWVDRQGQVTSLGAPLMSYVYPRISPDGNRVAIDVPGAAARDIWMWDIPRRTLERFTKDPAGNPLVAWSPDGRYLAFGNEVSGVSNVYRQAADGSGQPEHLLESKAVQMPISYAPDGRLLVSVVVPNQQRDIHVMTMDGTHSTKPLIQGPANELWAEVSPDGHWVAYDSDESGQFEVYVRPFPDAYGGGRWQISAAGGRQPLWSPDGRELFYRDFSGALMSVPVAAGPAFAPGRPTPLLQGGDFIGGGASGSGRTYDISPDASRFLMIRSVNEGPGPLVVVLNWFEELKRLAPIH